MWQVVDNDGSGSGWGLFDGLGASIPGLNSQEEAEALLSFFEKNEIYGNDPGLFDYVDSYLEKYRAWLLLKP